jgi:hypothetical protein
MAAEPQQMTAEKIVQATRDLSGVRLSQTVHQPAGRSGVCSLVAAAWADGAA